MPTSRKPSSLTCASASEFAIEVDMYGRQQEFEGRITGFNMGTGAALALLPPQNASGNFVKIVQRLPVRIELTDYHPEKAPPVRGPFRLAVCVLQGACLRSARRRVPPAAAFLAAGFAFSDGRAEKQTGRKRPMSTGEAAAPAGNPWLVAVTVTLATFMEVLDTTIANVSLPYIAGDLGVSVDEASWVLTTYLVANAVVLPTAGWMSGLIGRKRFYMGCVLLFTVCSALCGSAPNLSTLLLCRIFQGAGGGGLQPSEQGILLDTFVPSKRGMAMAVYGVAILVAPILGPTLGGYITENYNWRWIFFINVPVGCLSLFLTSLLVHDPPYMEEERQALRGKPLDLDLFGLGLIAVGLAALEIIYDRGQEDDWFNSRFILTLLVLGIVSLSTAVFWELRHPRPIVNLRAEGPQFRGRQSGHLRRVCGPVRQ